VTPDLAHLAAEVGQVRADLDALLALLSEAAAASQERTPESGTQTRGRGTKPRRRA
jgi:hypothetical protein